MTTTIHVGNKEKGLFVTNEHAANRNAAAGRGKGGRKTLFAGDLTNKPDSILLKRQQAQKQALKVVGDVFAADKKIDESMNDMKDRTEELKAEKLTALDELEKLAQRREELTEAGYAEDSEEMLELAESEKLHRTSIAKAESEMKAISRSIGDTKIERLKSSPMVGASNTAEEIMEAANKDILGELMNEGKKHIEEKMQEEKEKTEKLAEKKEEEEEKAEKKEEKEAQTELWIEETKDSAAKAEASAEAVKEAVKKTDMNVSDVEKMTEYNDENASADRELEEILDKLKLLQEDLKGCKVDTEL